MNFGQSKISYVAISLNLLIYTVFSTPVLASNVPGNASQAKNSDASQQGKTSAAKASLIKASTSDPNLKEFIWQTAPQQDCTGKPWLSKLVNEAIAACKQANYPKAITKYQDAISEAESHQQPILVAYAVQGLADCFSQQEKRLEAEVLYNRALSIIELAQGTDHIDVANILEGVALLHFKNKDYDKAESLYRRALAIKEKLLGLADPGVGTSLNGIAVICWKQERLSEAIQLHERALKIYEKILGPNHREFAKTVANLALCHMERGELVEAEKLYGQAKDIFAKQGEHAALAQTLRNYVVLLKKMGKEDEAKLAEAKAQDAEAQGVSCLPSSSLQENSREEDIAKATNVDFVPYMLSLQQRIKRVWQPPKGNESNRVVVVFKISKHGKLSSLRVSRSSGVEQVDSAAVKAIRRCNPFASLPEGAPAAVDIEFTFDYNVFCRKERLKTAFEND